MNKYLQTFKEYIQRLLSPFIESYKNVQVCKLGKNIAKNTESLKKDKYKRRYTIFCDIDGCLIEHPNGIYDSYDIINPKLLPGVKEKFIEWNNKQYIIVITSGRKESHRKLTEQQLAAAGLMYDQLILGISNAFRVIINDEKSSFPGEQTAIGITLPRNEGLINIDI